MWMIAKKLHPHPKPQIQDVEPMRRILGTRTLPCVVGEDARIKKLLCVFVECFWVFFGVWKREKT